MFAKKSAKNKIKKVSKALKKASNTHAKQAKTLQTIKLKKGGSVPSNVANPSLYSKVKSEAKRKFDVFPSAYASAWLVRTYKKRGGKYKGAKGKATGGVIHARNGGFIAKGCGAVMQNRRKKTKMRGR
jgi:hypothetical protein|tara:strand:- start:1965 stop:2348 length:384 start_codon:yes stop_codon:yes gene_type:complete